MPGITCAYLAAVGNPGTLMNPSCVLLAFSPFATVTTIGFAVFFFCSSGASICKKWLLAPESNIAHSRMFSKFVLIVEVRLIGGGCHDGAPTFANNFRAASVYLDLCDCFLCLSE